MQSTRPGLLSPCTSTLYVLGALSMLCIAAPANSSAQTPESAANGGQASAPSLRPLVPQQVRYAGKLPTRAGDTVEAVFRIYSAQEGGEPLWSETQPIAIGEDGSYTVLLGSATPAGLPQTVFAGGAARWLGVSVERGPEQDRTLLSSVPYAMKSADAESLAGHAATDFVTQDQLAAIAGQPGSTTRGPLPETGGDVTGSGTTNAVPLWTSSSTIGNSVLTQSGTSIGINIAAPAATLDVNGGAVIRGNLNLPAPAKATTSAGQHSNLFEFSASAWSSTANAPEGETFFMVADPTGNNTASPSAVLNFQFKNGSAAPATVLSVAGNGVVTFSPTQTFPGTISSVTGTGPITATTASGAVTVGLNSSALESTLNAVYPQLGSYNTFISGATFGGESAFTGSSTDWMLVVTNQSTSSKGTILGQAAGNELGIEGASPGGIGVEGATDTGTGVEATSDSTGNALVATASGTGIAAYISSSNASGPAEEVTNNAGGAAFTASATTSNAGVFSNNSASYVAVAGENSSADAGAVSTYGSISNGTAVYGIAGAGTGVYGASTSGYGVEGKSGSNIAVYGLSNASTGVWGQSSGSQGVGVLGASSYIAVEGSFSGGSATGAVNGPYSGVWGDAGAAGAGVVGTADNSIAGAFVNNSNEYPTLTVNNEGSASTGLFRTLSATDPSGACGVGSGNLSCTGQVKTLVSVGGGARKVETYAMQSPENWMEDFGSETLEQGVAVVKIDPTFAETVSESAGYHVFLTPKGDSKGLYVINETPGSFEVRESGGGVSSLAFDYRIVAKRRGFEGQRHVDVTERYRAAMESTRRTGTEARGGESTPLAAPAVDPHVSIPLVQHPQVPLHTAPPPARGERLLTQRSVPAK